MIDRYLVMGAYDFIFSNITSYSEKSNPFISIGLPFQLFSLLFFRYFFFAKAKLPELQNHSQQQLALIYSLTSGVGR